MNGVAHPQSPDPSCHGLTLPSEGYEPNRRFKTLSQLLIDQVNAMGHITALQHLHAAYQPSKYYKTPRSLTTLL